jgi:amino acid transporter
MHLITSDNNTSENNNNHNNKLRRELGIVDGLCVVISIMIGSGIFASPGLALEKSGSPGATLVMWFVSGILVITASFCYAELGAMLPSAGGDYEYLVAAYGESAGFMFAWYFFWISKPVGISAFIYISRLIIFQ